MRKITLKLSDESVSMLEQLVDIGIYGKTAQEVAERFVDQALQGFVSPSAGTFTFEEIGGSGIRKWEMKP